MGNRPASRWNRWLIGSVLGAGVGVMIVMAIGFLSMDYRETQSGFTYEIQMSFQQAPWTLLVVPSAALVGAVVVECVHWLRGRQRSD